MIKKEMIKKEKKNYILIIKELFSKINKFLFNVIGKKEDVALIEKLVKCLIKFFDNKEQVCHNLIEKNKVFVWILDYNYMKKNSNMLLEFEMTNFVIAWFVMKNEIKYNPSGVYIYSIHSLKSTLWDFAKLFWGLKLYENNEEIKKKC